MFIKMNGPPSWTVGVWSHAWSKTEKKKISACVPTSGAKRYLAGATSWPGVGPSEARGSPGQAANQRVGPLPSHGHALIFSQAD